MYLEAPHETRVLYDAHHHHAIYGTIHMVSPQVVSTLPIYGWRITVPPATFGRRCSQRERSTGTSLEHLCPRVPSGTFQWEHGGVHTDRPRMPRGTPGVFPVERPRVPRGTFQSFRLLRRSFSNMGGSRFLKGERGHTAKSTVTSQFICSGPFAPCNSVCAFIWSREIKPIWGHSPSSGA